MINMNALTYFVETARLQSFTAAAHTLGVSQSTVSKMIKILEHELGDELIIRQKKPLLLTASGQHLFTKGQEILAQINQLENDIHNIQSIKQGQLSIGIPPMVNLLFTSTLKEFRRAYPGIKLNIFEPPGPAVEKMVAEHQADFGFSIAPIEQELGLSSEVIASYKIFAIGKDELLNSLKSPLTLKQVCKKPLLMLNADFAIHRLLQQHFAAQQLQPNIFAHSSQWDWLISMAQAGLGIALLPEPFCQWLPADLSAKEINESELNWQVALLWNGRYLSESALAWLAACQHQLPGSWLQRIEHNLFIGEANH